MTALEFLSQAYMLDQQIQTALETNTIQVYDISASTAEDFINENGSVKVLKYPCSWPVLLTLNSAPGAVFENNPTLRKI